MIQAVKQPPEWDEDGAAAEGGSGGGDDRGGAPKRRSADADAQIEASGGRIRPLLRARLGEEVYSSWFHSLEIEGFDGHTVRASVPVKFLRQWITTHYAEALLECCRAEFPDAQAVDVIHRQPSAHVSRLPQQAGAGAAAGEVRPAMGGPRMSLPEPSTGEGGRRPIPAGARTQAGSFEGSPLDPRYSFESFVVGPANRLAHAGATQVAETVFSETRGFNPLYIHSSVGLGKTHLLHAIAWEVKRRTPHAQLLYLTAERFRSQFVGAIKAQDGIAFKDKFGSIDMLLIDDLEFMSGEKTEIEFDHIINWLLDGGRQLVVASSRAPNQLDRLNDRMRSRLQRGLVVEVGALDYDLRLRILERRVAEKRSADPSFEVPRPVLEMLADRLAESGRELEGAITRLYATWQYMRAEITLELASTIVRDLMAGIEPRRIKIDDILRIVSRHFGVNRADLLSQRRHRSVVWPRQIGMYLAKQMTARSLPEIGRRFGNRDHTTVLHAIRKIEGELKDDMSLRDELEKLRKEITQ